MANEAAVRAAVDVTVRALEDAWRDADGGAAAALGFPGEAVPAERLRAIAANVAVLDLREVTLGRRLAVVSGGGQWSTTLQVSWRVAGMDQAAATVTLPVGFRLDQDRALVARLGPRDRSGQGAGRLPLWLAGPVSVRSGPGWQVVNARGAGHASTVAAAARRAQLAVSRALHREVAMVVELPPDAAAYASVLGAPRGEFSALAAVTTTADGSAGSRAPRRVVVNPALLARLDRRALTVVLAHEAVHVAFGDATGSGPAWFREGFADFVALRALGLRAVTDAAVAEVALHGVPGRLPTAGDFTGSGRALEAAYERSWLACRLIADEAGQRALVRLRAVTVRGGRPFSSALPAVTGISSAELTRRWRAGLARLAD